MSSIMFLIGATLVIVGIVLQTIATVLRLSGN